MAAALVVLLAAFSAALPLSAAAAPKAVLDSFGTPNGKEGGQLIWALGVAVNRSGVGASAGSVYIAEANTNHRISQFGPEGEFIRTWGYDVVDGVAFPGAPNDNGTGFEICDVTNGNTAKECKNGLAGGAAGQLGNPHGIAVDQSSGYLYVTSENNLRVDVFTGAGAFVGAFGWDVDPAGGTGFEICTTACKAAAAAGGDAGRFNNFDPSYPAVDPNIPGRVYVPDRGNLRVNQFSVTAVAGELTAVSFDKAFGWDVIPVGQSGDTGTGLESCTTATTCQAGTSGNGSGQFASNYSPTAVAVDSAGAIYVTSGPLSTGGTCSPATPCRVQKFAPDASSATNFGPISGPGQLTFTSGAANTVAALNIALDPVNDHVYVLRKGKGLGGETPSSTEYQIHEYESDGKYVETHPAPAGSALLAPSVATGNSGLAVGLDDRLYVNYGAAGKGEVFILGVKLDPHPTMSGVGDVGATTATFEGTVEVPPPGVADYHFEYSTDESTWASVPPQDRSVGGGTPGTYPVSIEATGLEPNTEYFVRLVATTGNEPIVSNVVNFTTGQAPPRVGLLYTEGVTQTEALLSARLDPEGLESSYHFEWTTQSQWEATGEYANRVPASDVAIGSGGDAVIVQDLIQGLEPGTAYRFRVVVENASGETTGAQVFETLNQCGFTGGRCLELVSPSDKGAVGAAGDVVALGQELQFQASSSGSSIAYVMAYGLKKATSGNEVVYRADREGSNWKSTQISAPNILPSVNGVTSFPSKVKSLSSDLSCGVLASTELLTPDAPEGTRDAGQANLYRQDDSGSYELITVSEPSNLSAAGTGEPLELFDVIGMSEAGEADCGTIVFRTPFQYPGVPGAGTHRSYEWDEGNLYNVGIVPGPSGLEVAEATPGASDQGGSSVAGQLLSNHWNAVSEDATRIYFTAISRLGGDLGQQAVFMRERAKGTGDVNAGSAVITNASADAAEFVVGQEVSGPGLPVGTTIVSVGGGTLELSKAATATAAGASLRAVRVIDVSQSQNPGTPNDSRAQYETASKNGSLVFFTARYGLTEEGTPSSSTSCEIGNGDAPNGLGCALYRYSVEDGTLTEMSVAGEETNNAKGPSVAGVLGASNDGSRVYFAARGQLTPEQGFTEQQNLADDSYNVYLSDNGQLSYVGRLGYGFTSDRALLSSSREWWTTRVSPDGRHLLFASKVPFTELGKADGGSRNEAYLYDAESDISICVSCRKDDALSLSPPDANPLVSRGEKLSHQLPPMTLAVSEEGEARAFFISYNPLATGAVSGRPNLYMWENGQTSFLGSSGPSTAQELRFAGASATGDDVYFTTVDRLTWQDTDSKLDVYDVRVGGGVAQPPAPPAPCNPLAESACQAPTPAAPPPPTPGSATFTGPEQVKEPKKKKGKNKKQKGKRNKGKQRRKGKGKGGNRPSATGRGDK